MKNLKKQNKKKTASFKLDQEAIDLLEKMKWDLRKSKSEILSNIIKEFSKNAANRPS